MRDEAVSLVPGSGRDRRELVTQKQICERFGISDETWRNWRKAGLTPTPVDLPGRPRWRVEDVDAFSRGRWGAGRPRRYFNTAVVRRRA